MEKELQQEIFRIAKEDVELGYDVEMKHELNNVLSECGFDVKNLDEAYDLYIRTYATHKSIKEDI